MLFPEKMKKISVLALKEHAEKLSRELLSLGVLEFVPVRDFTGIKTGHDRNNSSEWTSLRKRVESCLEQGSRDTLDGVVPESDDWTPPDREETGRKLDALAQEIITIREKQKDLQQKILQNGEMLRYLAQFPDSLDTLPAGKSLYLRIEPGNLPASQKESLEKALSGYPHLLLAGTGGKEGDRMACVLVFLVRDERDIDKILTRFSWTDSPFSRDDSDTLIMIDSNLKQKGSELEAQQKGWNEKLLTLIDQRSDELVELWKKIRVAELGSLMREHYGTTGSAILFSGWVPAAQIAEVERTVRETAGTDVYLEITDAPRDDSGSAQPVPVQLRNPSFLRPFEKLVVNYSLPRYGTVDPTPLVAITYLLMFGLMFGDLGQGFVILILGFLGMLKFRKDPAKLSLSRLITWCGGSAMVFGILFGSCFGRGIFPALWFNYHGVVLGEGVEGQAVGSVLDILGLTLQLGIVVVALGLILNWVNCIKRRRWLEFFLDKKGLLGGWLYAGGVASLWPFVTSGFKEFPPASFVFFAVLLPASLIPLKPVLEVFVHRHKGEKVKIGKLMLHAMEGVVEILEAFTGFLSSTLSFMRVAGLGIAHVSLMMAFSQIADLTGSPWIAIPILVLGNALVIVLEGLSAGIQSLRLNYYEFFTKYFVGAGKAYVPLKLGR
jgi:V/A-type H+-transporting ATPase subunit I